MHARRHVLIVALVLLTAALIVPAAAQAMTYDEAIDSLYARGYPQTVESYLNSLGTSPLGFRLGGTSADDTAANYLAKKLRAAGYTNVKLEAVPVDEWSVQGATVNVFGRRIVCSQFAGVPGTGEDGIRAPVVYVGSGTAADYSGVDVAGKIVVVDSSMDNFWFNFQGAEASKHGALAVILTSNFSETDPAWPSAPWYIIAPDALGANDGEYDMSFAPMVYMSQADGDWLKNQIFSFPFVTATLTSTVNVTMAGQGGEGYNVVATLPGKKKNGQMVVMDAHHDAHFRAGLDDTGAVVATLAAAKAMKMSGYRPNRTIVFLFDTAEEFGYTNCWYDWSIGAWHFITQKHPKWAGKIAAMYSIELMAAENATVDINTSPELVPWLNKICSDNSAMLPNVTNPFEISTPQSTWQNGWSFMASGVPSFEISAGGAGFDDLYHSTYENEDLVDWDATAAMSKLFMRMNAFLDTKQLPYDFVGRADDLAKHVDANELQAAGVSAGVTAALDTAIAKFRAAADKFGASAASIAGKRGPAKRNATMLKAAKKVLKGMTALDAWDSTAYPHEQTMWDVEYMDAALAALQANPVDPAKASENLAGVGINWNGTVFSPSVYRFDLTRHDPEYDRITWGGLGKPIIQFDMTPVMAWIGSGEYDRAIAKIQTMRAVGAADLESRVANMVTALNQATSIMKKAM